MSGNLYQSFERSFLFGEDSEFTKLMAKIPRCKVTEAGVTKSYDLDLDDKFWMVNKGMPFPEVAEAVQAELEDYRSSEDEIKR